MRKGLVVFWKSGGQTVAGPPQLRAATNVPAVAGADVDCGYIPPTNGEPPMPMPIVSNSELTTSIATPLRLVSTGNTDREFVKDVPRAPVVLKENEPATKLVVVLSHWNDALNVCVQRAVPEGGGQALLPLNVKFDIAT
jgi:hypothetical protein